MVRELTVSLALIGGLALVLNGLREWSTPLAMVAAGVVLIFLAYVVANATE